MKIAITGAAGLFGNGLARVFGSHHQVFSLTHAEMNITSDETTRAVMQKIAPEIVIHPAGIPDIDQCEADPARAFLVNFHGTRSVTEAARQAGAAVVYISSDTVFDGKKNSPYTELDATGPITVYGRTKLRAEQFVLDTPGNYVFRVSALFGPGKTNFVEKVLRKIRAREEVVVASNQLGSATYTIDAAKKIMEVVEARRPGLYHLSNSGPCTRFELARRAAEMAGVDARYVIGKQSGQMGRRAPRLEYAVMEMQALQMAGITLPRPWEEALEQYIEGL